MAHLWDKNKGHQRNEREKTYKLFKVYLRLGVHRNLRRVEEITGESYHNLYGMARRFNWKERAEAFDRFKEEGNDVSEYETEVITEEQKAKPIELKPVRVLRSSAPTRQVNEQIIRERLTDLGGLVHEEKMKEFAMVYEERGRKIFEKGKHILEMIDYCANRIKENNEKQARYLEMQEIESYLNTCKVGEILVNQYFKLWKSFEVADGRARADWGDAIGVGQLLEAMYRQVQ